MRARGRSLKSRLAQLRRRGLLLFATVPFALLANSSQVTMRLRIEADGGALRQITVAASPYFQDQLPKWVADVQAGGRWNVVSEPPSTVDSYFYGRDFRTNNANYDQGRLTIDDVLQNPLSLYTTYTWKEDLNIAHVYQSDYPAATAAGKQLKYVILMPGEVTEASAVTGDPTRPSQAKAPEIEGSAATFALPADQGKYTVTVIASRLRWGYVVVVLYLLAFIAFEVLRVVGRVLRRRPRKI